MTKDPIQKAVRDALIGYMAATAEAQAEVTRETQRAGIAAAKIKGDRYRGRKPSFNRNQFETVLGMVGQGLGTTAISKATGLTRQSVIRIRDDLTTAESVLMKWGM